MKAAFLLMAQHDGFAVIPIEEVCRDYFRHLTAGKLIRKIDAGEIQLPLVRMERSQEAARGLHLNDLADWIDARTAEAREECEQLATALQSESALRHLRFTKIRSSRKHE